MTSSLTKTFTVDATPAEAFAAIIDVRAWWSGNVVGPTDTLGADFVYVASDLHYSKFRITELVPDRSTAWVVLDSYLSFIDDKEEWTGTTVRFEVLQDDGRTQVRFTHEGLAPADECYDVCDTAWESYVVGSLRALIEKGSGRPGSFEGPEGLAAARAGRAMV
ncbi:SRPBCC family protein [Mumia sp. Pv 4-285]|uniref:SRPBCC family protein n=1 Tax=Mumia qirimensis TaxID=3234852 RepID=UPI00351D5FB5